MVCSKPEQKAYGSYSSNKLMDHSNQKMETHWSTKIKTLKLVGHSNAD